MTYAGWDIRARARVSQAATGNWRLKDRNVALGEEEFRERIRLGRDMGNANTKALCIVGAGVHVHWQSNATLPV